jgi:DNA (cytosine-5)-methyltransferase 1
MALDPRIDSSPSRATPTGVSRTLPVVLADPPRPVTRELLDREDREFLTGAAAAADRSAHATPFGIVDLFSGCGGLTIGAIEGARRQGRSASLQLAVDSWDEALEVLADSLGLDDGVATEFDLTQVLGGVAEPRRPAERPIVERGAGADLLLAGPPCQGHSALNNSTRHDDARNDLYLAVARVARLLEPRAVVVENVRGVGSDRRRALQRCAAALQEQGYHVDSLPLNLHELGAPQRRIRHVLVAARDGYFDFSALQQAPGRDVAWAIGDLEHVDGRTLFDTAAVPTVANAGRIDWLFDNDIHDLPDSQRPDCHRDGDHSYRSVYGRLFWDRPAQTITSGFGSMGQGRFVHPRARRTITPHEAARLQFLPDSMDFSSVDTRAGLATMIGNAAPPILGIAVVRALIEQDLL